jgi:hypothetical protein
MLLFRSEENVVRWCRVHDTPVRPLVTLEQLWFLAETWYGNRLTVDSRRPGPDEMASIFSRVGLVGPFWEPNTDHWGAAG